MAVLRDLITPAPIDRCGERNFPVLSMTMHDGIILQRERFKKSLASVDQSAYKVVRRDQLVVGFPIDEGVLYVQKAADVGIMSPAYDVWNVNQGLVDLDYLELSLHSPQSMQYYKTNLRGTTARRRSLPKDVLLALPIKLPDVSTQKCTVNIIAKVKKTISLRQQQLSALDDLIKARFVELFGRPEDKKYSSVRLGDYAKLQGGFAFKSKDFIDEGVPLVQIGNVNKDYLDWDVVNAVPEKYIDKYSEFALNKDDLVMAMTRPIIKSLDSVKIAKVSETDLPCLLNQRVGRFQIKDKIHPVFLEILCKTDDFKDYVERMSGNSLQPNISSKQVEDYIIILPPKELQEQFARFVKQTDKSKVAVQKALDEAQLLFDSLMQEYFG